MSYEAAADQSVLPPIDLTSSQTPYCNRCCEHRKYMYINCNRSSKGSEKFTIIHYRRKNSRGFEELRTN